jgi:serine/threonine protein kinase
MGSAPVGPLHLPPGTQVGPWRVEAWRGQGAYGAVYRAVRVGQESAGPVALKLALHIWDRRFGREAELLSRVSHPSIPRLLDRGVLVHPSGAEHAWFVMEWVEGTPLYAWAEQHAASSREVCRVLAQVARALEAMHAAGCVHRDVKGDNVLVRLSDRCAVLLDFGSGHFQGAERLTWQGLAPGTPGYFSAQACLFDLNSVRNRDGYYAPVPADDLYALGVTAYRLMMGDYPPPMDVRKDEEGSWHVTSPDPRPLLENNPRVEPLLREWILRLLSDDPEARGTAAQVAQALEAVERECVPALKPAVPAGAGELRERSNTRRSERSWALLLALAAAGISAVLLWSGQHMQASSSRDASKPSSEKTPTAQEPLPEPRPGQTRPEAKGRCPGRTQVLINGGCWVENPVMTAETCTENGYVFLKGKCYAPALESPRRPLPNSSDTQEP